MSSESFDESDIENSDTEEEISSLAIPFDWTDSNYIERFTKSLDSRKFEEYKQSIKCIRMRNSFLIYEYYFKHDSKHFYFSDKSTFYQFIVYFLSLDESEENRRNITNILICLFSTPYIFNHSTTSQIDIIVKNLVKFLNSDTNQIYINSIKCLQAVFMLYHISNYQFDHNHIETIFTKIWEILHKSSENLSIEPLAPTDYSFDSLEAGETDIIDFKKYLMIDIVQNYYSEFHAIVLLYYMIEVLRNTSSTSLVEKFQDYFYSEWLFDYVDNKKCSDVSINCYMAKVIKCLSYDTRFRVFLTKPETLSILLQAIQDDEAAWYLKSVFVNISQDVDAMNNIMMLGEQTIRQIVDAMVIGLRYAFYSDPFYFFDNLKLFPKIAQIPIEPNYITKIIDEIKHMSWMVNPTENLDNAGGVLEKVSVICNFIKYLGSAIHSEFYRKYYEISESKLYSINSIESLYMIANYFYENGVIKDSMTLPVCFEEDLIYEILLHACQRFCIYRRLNQIFDLRQNLLKFIYVLSCYMRTARKVKDCRIVSTCKINSGTSYFSTFRILLISMKSECVPINLPIFHILTNMMRFEIPIDACLTNESLHYFVDIPKTCKSVFDLILENKLLYQILKYSKNLYWDKDCEICTHALKALYFLSFHRRACQIVSNFGEYFETNFPLKIEILSTLKCKDSIFLEFYLYSKKLTCRVNANFFKHYHFYKKNMVDPEILNTPILTKVIDVLRKEGYTETVEMIMDSVKYSENFQEKEKISKEYLQKHRDEIESVIPLYNTFDHLSGDGSLFNAEDQNISKIVLKRATQFGTNNNKFRKNSLRTLFSSCKLRFSSLKDPTKKCQYVYYMKNDNIAIKHGKVLSIYDNSNFEVIWRRNIPSSTNSFSSSYDNNLFVLGEKDSYIFNISSVKNYAKRSYVIIKKTTKCEFTHDNKFVIGMGEKMHAKMYDIETETKLHDFWDGDIGRFHWISNVDINKTDQILLYNAGLYCIRSGKRIHKFETFNDYSGGIFNHIESEIIIDEQFWDIRTFKLIENRQDLKNKHVCKNTNTRYYFAHPYQKSNIFSKFGIHTMSQNCHIKNIDTIYFYDSNNFKCIGKIKDFDNKVNCIDVSNDFTQYAVNKYNSNTHSNHVWIYDFVHPTAENYASEKCFK